MLAAGGETIAFGSVERIGLQSPAARIHLRVKADLIARLTPPDGRSQSPPRPGARYRIAFSHDLLDDRLGFGWQYESYTQPSVVIRCGGLS